MPHMTPEMIEARRRVKALLQAHNTPDPLDDLVAHKNAVELGREILPIIRNSFFRVNWSTLAPRGKLGALTALMLAAYDVDEHAARELSAELTARKKCHSVFLQRLDSIRSFTLEAYRRFDSHGLKLYVTRSLEDPSGVAEQIRKWLSNVPCPDLEGIPRIYVVEKAERDHWGMYLRILATITLVWRGWNAQTRRQRLATEFTLYHEVGHHVHRARSGDREEDEALADGYAFERFGEAHPFIGTGLLGDFTIALTTGRARAGLA